MPGAQSRLDDELADLRATNQIVELKDLAQEPIAPEDNAATWLARARDDLDAIRKVLESLSESDQVAMEQGELTPAAEQVMDAALAEHAQLMGLLEQSARCADANFELELARGTQAFYDSVNSRVILSRIGCEVLYYHGLKLVAEGRADEALRTAIAMLRLAQHTERCPGLVGGSIAATCHALAVRVADFALRSKSTRQELRAELEIQLGRVDPRRLWHQLLSGERAVGTEHFREFYGPRRSLIWRIRFATDYCAFLKRFDDARSLIDHPYAHELARVETLDDKRDGGVLTALLTCNFDAILSGTLQDVARIRCLRVLNALVERADADAGEATVLDKLDLPAEAKTDPFDGRPLRLKKLAGGWLIYSVGPNLKDEGGRLNLYRDIGLGPPETWAPPDSFPE